MNFIICRIRRDENCREMWIYLNDSMQNSESIFQKYIEWILYETYLTICCLSNFIELVRTDLNEYRIKKILIKHLCNKKDKAVKCQVVWGDSSDWSSFLVFLSYTEDNVLFISLYTQSSKLFLYSSMMQLRMEKIREDFWLPLKRRLHDWRQRCRTPNYI